MKPTLGITCRAKAAQQGVIASTSNNASMLRSCQNDDLPIIPSVLRAYVLYVNVCEFVCVFARVFVVRVHAKFHRIFLATMPREEVLVGATHLSFLTDNADRKQTAGAWIGRVGIFGGRVLAE